MKKALLIFLTWAACISAHALPSIGAQVFIEPGQTEEQIDGYFQTLENCDMDVARIRMFGAHIMAPDGSTDFSLYDTAFDAAARHGVRLFATLFPPTDELTDVGGFKFPRSKRHLDQVAHYIRTTVAHFSNHPALDTWVLQNEPGTGSNAVKRTDLSDSIRSLWEAGRSVVTTGLRKDYLSADFTDFEFLRYYTAWYLQWIASQVRAIDSVHNLHINPHALLAQLPEYDFRSFEPFLTSLGVSMHQSWHFGDFRRDQYPLGCSLMCDIIRQRAGKNPFWVTELQGGNVTASGYVPYCPTSQEIAQFLWVDIAAGAQGGIFWTLNPRRAVMEAGEWAMLNFQGHPSDRLISAANVAKTLKHNHRLFDQLKPIGHDVALLYCDEALHIQKLNSASVTDKANDARHNQGVMRGIIAAYEALSSLGATVDVSEMSYFDWDVANHKAVIIPHSIALPKRYIKRLEDYARAGGKIIATGLTGYYDEHMRCMLMEQPWPLKPLFGGELSEVKCIGKFFPLPVDGNGSTVDAHLWRGIINPGDCETVAADSYGCAVARNTLGLGQVWWIPSPIELGAYGTADNTRLTQLYQTILSDILENAPLRFTSPQKGVLMRLCESPAAKLAIVVNTNDTPKEINLKTTGKLHLLPATESTLNGNILNIPPHGVSILRWK